MKAILDGMSPEGKIIAHPSSIETQPVDWMWWLKEKPDIAEDIAALRPNEPEPTDLELGKPIELKWHEKGVRDYRCRSFDGRTIAAQRRGNPDGNVKHVVVLHGTPSGRVGPAPDVERLDHEGIELITIDRPGYGCSDRKAGRRVCDAAADVLAVTRTFEIDSCIIVGRSGGAAHALACAALLKGNLEIEQTIAIGAMAPIDAVGLDRYEGMGIENDTRSMSDDELAEETIRRAEGIYRDPWSQLEYLAGLPDFQDTDKAFVGNPGNAIRLAISHWLAVSGKNGEDGPCPWGWVDDELAFRQPWGFDLGDIETPVTLWTGEKDMFTPMRHALWLAEQIKGAHVETSPNLSHFNGMDLQVFLDTFLAEHKRERFRWASEVLARAIMSGGASHSEILWRP